MLLVNHIGKCSERIKEVGKTCVNSEGLIVEMVRPEIIVLVV